MQIRNFKTKNVKGKNASFSKHITEKMEWKSGKFPIIISRYLSTYSRTKEKYQAAELRTFLE